MCQGARFIESVDSKLLTQRNLSTFGCLLNLTGKWIPIQLPICRVVPQERSFIWIEPQQWHVKNVSFENKMWR